MVKATLRNNKPAATTPQPAAPVVDVPATPVIVDEDAAANLVATLEAGGTPSEAPASFPTDAPLPVATVPTAAVAVKGAYDDISGGAITGEFDQSDLRFPYISMVRGSGALKERFAEFSVVLGDELLLDPPASPRPGVAAQPPPTFLFVPVCLQKYFRENLSKEEIEAQVIPRTATTLAEVHAAGGTTQFVGDSKPTWSPACRNRLLVRCPEGCAHPNFTIELDGHLYAVADFMATGSSYRTFSQPIFNASMVSLLVPVMGSDGPVKNERGQIQKRPFLAKNFWSFNVTKKVSGDYVVGVPEVRLLRNQETGPEVREFITSMLS